MVMEHGIGVERRVQGQGRAAVIVVRPRRRRSRGLSRNGSPGGLLGEMDPVRVAQGLGWLSIGLGVVQVLAPRLVGGLIGAGRRHTGVIQAMGVREIGHGAAIFSQKHPTEAVWSRVGGDVLDLALLATALGASGTGKGRLLGATAAVAGVTALDVACARQLSREGRGLGGANAVHVLKSVTINRPLEEVYDFWRDFQNLPRFMRHLEAVQVMGDGRSHWVAKAPAGSSVEWDAEIIEERPGEIIAWRSVEGSDVDNAGSVRFERGAAGRGTVVRIDLRYAPPGGKVAATVAKLFGEEPEQQITEDLRRFKQVMETGEVVSAESPRGSCIG